MGRLCVLSGREARGYLESTASPRFGAEGVTLSCSAGRRSVRPRARSRNQPCSQLRPAPASAVKDVKRLEALVECPVALLSTSPDHDDTIWLSVRSWIEALSAQPALREGDKCPTGR
jgi:hypothetical protein